MAAQISAFLQIGGALEAGDVEREAVVLAGEELENGAGDRPAQRADGGVAEGHAEAARMRPAKHLPPGEIRRRGWVSRIFLGCRLRAARRAPTGDSAPIAVVGESRIGRRGLFRGIDV